MVTTLGVPRHLRFGNEADQQQQPAQAEEGKQEDEQNEDDDDDDVFAEQIPEDPLDGEEGMLRKEHLNSPEGVCVGPDGSIYVTDTIHCCVRKVSPAGRVTNVAGDGSRGQRDGRAQVADFDGADTAPHAQFRHPRGVAVDDVGNLFVCDTENHTLRGISCQGRVSTLAGSGSPGFKDGPALQVCCCHVAANGARAHTRAHIVRVHAASHAVRWHSLDLVVLGWLLICHICRLII